MMREVRVELEVDNFYPYNLMDTQSIGITTGALALLVLSLLLQIAHLI
jgi:hypothetical protein